MPQFLVTEELVELASNAIDSFNDVFLISVDDSGEYKKAEGADEVMAKSDLVLTNKENSGFAITCNKGFKWIMENEKEDCYIICANNDIKVHDRVVPELRKPFEMFENVAITGIFSTKGENWEGKPLEEMCVPRMGEGGQHGDRMMDGGLWMSKKSILQKLAIYRKV